MLEIQAVIGRIQLRRMTEWTAIRADYSKALWNAARPYAAVRIPDFNLHEASISVHAHYKCYLYVQPERLKSGWTRDRIIAAIQLSGVPAYQGSCSEVYLERAFDGTGWRPLQPLPVAHALGETSLMFLVHPTLTSAEIEKSCSVISRVLAEATA